MSTVKPMHTNLVYALALIFIVLGLLGYLDFKNYTYLGYESNDYKVTKIDDGSPAAESGMQVGDQIKTIDGRNVRDPKAWKNVPRSKAGESREYVVDRDGEELSYTLTYASQQGKQMMLNRLGWTVGLIFVLMGLWAFIKNKNWAALMFAMFALGLGSSFLGAPYIADPTMRELVASIRFPFVLLSFAFLVAFLMHFPERDAFLDRKNANWILFGPAVFLSLVIIFLNILDPESTSMLNTTVDMLFLLFILFYFGWAILKMIGKYKSASAEERQSTGVGLMFWGTLIGLVPVLIVVVLDNLAPTVSLPGEDYVFLSFVLVPICFAIAINRRAAATA